jgi:drug/metabolite transporter (DMT)-like permease
MLRGEIVDAVALLLVLLAALFHAAWNRFLHDTDDRVASLAVAGLSGFVLLSPAILAAPPFAVWPLILLSALAEVAYALCLSAAYRRGLLSLTYPIGRGTGPLLVVLYLWLVARQATGIPSLAAAACLAIGLAVIATARRRATDHTALGFAFLVGATIATYSLIDSRAVHSVSPAAYLGVVLGIEGLLLSGLVLSRPRAATRLRGSLRPGALVAVGSVGAYLLVLLAFQRSGAGPVTTLREVSVLIGLLLARETVGGRVWAGGALVVAGAVLAAL